MNDLGRLWAVAVKIEEGVDLCPLCGEGACRDMECSLCPDCGAAPGQACADGCREQWRKDYVALMGEDKDG